MRKKYVVVEDNSTGCCNLVVWDFLAVAIWTGATLEYEFELHMVFCIILGILAGILFIILMSRKFIGTILKVICSIFWTWAILSLLDDFFNITEIIAGDMIWTWFIRIVLFFICLGLHVVNMEDISDNKHQNNYQPFDTPDDIEYINDHIYSDDLTRIQEEADIISNDFKTILSERNTILKQAEEFISKGTAPNALHKAKTRNHEQYLVLINKYNHYVNKLNNAHDYKSASKAIMDLRKCLNSMKTENQYILNELNKILYAHAQNHSSDKYTSSDKNIDETLFSGCKTKDDLTKRYRKLMQTFHPDNSTGDTEMTQKIQNTYEHLLKKM